MFDNKLNIPSGIRAIFLAQLLWRRGIPLGVPWRDALPCNSVRVYFLLENTDLETLGEILQALGNDNKESALGTNVTRTAIGELWEAFELLAGPAVTHFDPSFVESIPEEELFSNIQPESRWDRQRLSAHMLARIEAAGVDTAQPWQDALPAVSTRAQRALRQFVTLREVVIAATDDIDSLRKVHNFGRAALHELWVLLEALAVQGMDSVCPTGPETPPTTIDELVTWVLQSASEKDRHLLSRRFLDGATLEQIGREEGVSKNTVRIWILRILRQVRVRLGDTTEVLMEPLINAMAESGGVLHRDLAREFASTDDLRRICLAGQIAGLDLRIRREEFLTILSRGQREDSTISHAKIIPFPLRSVR